MRKTHTCIYLSGADNKLEVGVGGGGGGGVAKKAKTRSDKGTAATSSPHVVFPTRTKQLLFSSWEVPVSQRTKIQMLSSAEFMPKFLLAVANGSSVLQRSPLLVVLWLFLSNYTCNSISQA